MFEASCFCFHLGLRCEVDVQLSESPRLIQRERLFKFIFFEITVYFLWICRDSLVISVCPFTDGFCRVDVVVSGISGFKLGISQS